MNCGHWSNCLENIYEPSPTSAEYHIESDDVAYAANTFHTDEKTFPEEMAWTTGVPSTWGFVADETVVFKMNLAHLSDEVDVELLTLRFDNGPIVGFNIR